jgi:signal transduction histidine kinase
VSACLLLVFYIGFLVNTNYRSQIALRESSTNRFRLDLEKRAASLGYFFSERKYDLKSLALSREINTYFINKALGMSEQYGLKINLFMIERVLRQALEDKHIRGGKIYERFVFLDSSGRSLVDTAAEPGERNLPFPKSNQRIARGEPDVYVVHENGVPQIVVTAPCYHKGKMVGKLTALLNLEILFSVFIDFADVSAFKGSGLVDESCRLLCLPERGDEDFAIHLTPVRVAGLSATNFSFLPHDGKGEMLVARLPIHNTDLSFVAWMPREEILGPLTPSHLIVGMGSLALVVLAALVMIIWFTIQNLILKARFDESERQQGLLASKNQQLSEEMQKRKEAEEQLEAQRTLRMRSDRLRSLGEMAAGIAHELNQPLVGVRGFAELIVHSLDHGLEMPMDKIRSNTSKIIEQADRMVHIINHVRRFARDADGMEASLVDLNEVVHSGATLLTAQFSAHGLLLEEELAPQALPVRVNPFSVEEVLLNLLSNARHSVEEKRKTSGEGFRPCVSVYTKDIEKNGRNVIVLAVTDNGMGIPANIAEKIFDPFFTTKDPDKGTGLGLSICKSIVETFQGQIQYTTVENEGTRFEVIFPRCST